MSIALVSYLEKQIEEKDAIIARLLDGIGQSLALLRQGAPPDAAIDLLALTIARARKLMKGKV